MLELAYIWLHLNLVSLGSSGGRVNFLVIAVVTNANRRSTDAATLARAHTNNLVVNGAGDAVVKLDVKLGQDVLAVDGSVADITDSSRLNHVTDGEALDSLVLGDHAEAVDAANGADVSASLLVASVGGSLLDHFGFGSLFATPS